MTKISVHREVLRMASFAILTSFLQTFVFVVDRALLGHYSSAALGQMQLSGTLEWSAFSVFAGFFAATFARIGRHVGAGDRPRANAAARLSVLFGFVFGVVLFLLTPLVLAILPELSRAASPELLSEARSYLGTTLRASPLVFVGAAAIASIQAGGDTKTPLAIGLVTNSVHLALNWVLVLGAFGVHGMGARGAGIGTAITFGLEAALAVLALSRKNARVSLRRVDVVNGERDASHAVDLRAEARALFSIGLPAMLEKIVYQSGFMAFVAIIASLGDLVMEANQALIGLESICFLSADGFGIAASALVAQKIGANDREAAPKVARSAAISACFWLFSLGALFFVFRAPLVSLFSTNARVTATSMSAMWVLTLAQPFMATAVVLAAALRGAGRTGVVFGVTSTGAFVVRLACTYTLAVTLHMGLVGVWLGSTCDWVVRTILLALLFARGAFSGKALQSSERAKTPS